MKISQVKKEAKAALFGKWGIAICAVIVGSIITSLISATGVGAFLTGLVAYGLASVFVSVIRRQDAKVEQLFDSLKNIGPTVIASVLKHVFLFLWTLLFCIPGLVKLYSYAMTEYILLDNPEISGNAAITESRIMMDGHKMELFLLDLSFIGWYILSALTCGILLLYVVPYYNAAKAAFYETLNNSSEPAV